MVIPALIETQALPGFTVSEGSGRLFNRLLNTNSHPAYSMDDILNLFNKVWRSLKTCYMEDSVVSQVMTELLKLIGVTSFNDLLMRRNFCSWKRGVSLRFRFTAGADVSLPLQPCKFSTILHVLRSGASHITCRRARYSWSIWCKQQNYCNWRRYEPEIHTLSYVLLTSLS